MVRSRQSMVVFVLTIPAALFTFYIFATLLTPSVSVQGSASGIAEIYAQALSTYRGTAVYHNTEVTLNPLFLQHDDQTPTPVDPQQVIMVAQGASPTPTIAVNPTYVIVRGDTLFDISRRFGISLDSIVAANNLVDINRISIGQVIILPLYSPTPTPTGLATVAVTPIELLTDSPTFTPSPTATPTATETPSPTPTTEIFPTNTPLPEVTSTPTDAVAADQTAEVAPEATRELLAISMASENAAPTLWVDNLGMVLIQPIPTALTINPQGETTINGIALNQYVVMDELTQQHVREIFALGQSLGRNPRAFSKVGDSTIENPFFMDRFDTPDGYNLGVYSWLQPTIDWFRGSFSRDSVAVRVAMHTWNVNDPMWADPYQCEGGESPLECEIRLNNPAFIFFRLGVNDVGVPDMVEANMRTAIELSLENGIVPIIGTKPDLRSGTEQNNIIMRQLAAEYHVPLWDFAVLAETIPGRGLGSDASHMTTYYLHDYTQPAAFQTGHGVHSLSGLIMLDSLWRVIYSDM